MRQPKQHKSFFSLLKTRSKSVVLATIGLLLVAGLAYPTASNVWAAKASCSSISDCDAQIAANNSAVADLKAEAVSYQDAVSRLNSQISQLQKKINYNQARQHKLQKQIAAKKAEIKRQRVVLGDVLRSMYVDGQMSTIEMLATSNSLSTYVDKEEYSNSVQNKIQTTLAAIAKMQAQLQKEESTVKQLLSEENQQRSELASARAEQNHLLSYNQSQQASYNAQTAANQKKLAALIAAQRAANESASPGGYYFLRFRGSVHSFSLTAYPYAHDGFSMSTAPGCNDGDGPDPWGYCTRQCVSYAAWAVKASGRKAPMYYGNAKNWVYAARRDGVPIYSTPRVGDVAISTHGTWGHAMYVIGVSGNTIHVAQYNQQLTGQFSTQWRVYR